MMKLKSQPIISHIHFVIYYPTVEANENLSNKTYKAISLCLDEPLADSTCKPLRPELYKTLFSLWRQWEQNELHQG